MSNGLHATMSPAVGSVGDTFVVGFSTPSEASDVRVTLTEIDAWGPRRGGVRERGRPTRIAQFRGQISNGQFSGTMSSPSSPAEPGPSVRIRFDGAGDDDIHTVPIPTGMFANEDGVLEIRLSAQARVGTGRRRRLRRYTMPQPVFLRYFRSGRPEVVFITGTRGGFFGAATQYWEAQADAVFHLSNVQAIREFLRTQADARGYGPWGDVSIVSHGNSVEWIVGLGSRDRRPRHLRSWHVEAARQSSAFSADISQQLDAQSRVIVRGCAIGHDQVLLDEIRSLFGGRATVKAPRHLQLYDVTGGVAREGFYEFFFFYEAAQNPPDDATCAARFAAKYRTAGISDADWLRMVQTRVRRGGQNPDGFRVDRRESVPWGPHTVTVNGPRRQARDHMASYDWLGEAASRFDNAEPHQNLETQFSDWHWVQGSVSERAAGPERTLFSRSFTGHRARIEIRRELRDRSGAPVRPNLDDASHYGTSQP